MTKFATLVASALLVVGCATVTPPAVRSDVESVVPAIQGTPAGAINDDVTQANIESTICVPGWTATVRPPTSYTNSLKAKLLHDQGLPAADAPNYELDHFIPLALGGAPRAPENLWLQPWDGEWGARTKDHLEVKLKTLVCKGALTLDRAREAVRRNWIEAFKTYVGLGKAGPALPEAVE